MPSGVRSPAASAIVQEFFRSAPESNPSTYILARRRDSTCANRPATSANMSSNPARHRSRRSSAIDSGAANALSFRHITPEVDHAVADSVIRHADRDHTLRLPY